MQIACKKNKTHAKKKKKKIFVKTNNKRME